MQAQKGELQLSASFLFCDTNQRQLLNKPNFRGQKLENRRIQIMKGDWGVKPEREGDNIHKTQL